ncbi:PREDICTED: disintegrin and metalloproteinase domain-containing protein 5-like [Elephantulus edwardii]|uniref:disintegrin and metalloproteinase domain-containing protein 5-like n=1 Tax=Elephantulus edwardii TaxID=28737 RepID=UPI0003F078C7|nr:PREDICTED: disintegrin and metalloproteinase domain-containing protein 5-like [Elephantulus edwardii]
MEAISGFVHMIYEDIKDNITIPPLRMNETLFWSDVLYSKYRKTLKFEYMGSDIQIVTQKVILIIGLVNAYPDGLSLESFAVVIVQLIGLNLGLSYNNYNDNCRCSTGACTMTSKAMHIEGIKDFSTCNVDEFKVLTSQSELECLLNQPFDKPDARSTTQIGICGNGILEHREQCDCGTTQIMPAGELCRKSYDDCDFPEFCPGTSGECMPDTYARDGSPCASNEGYCFKGKCHSVDRQCKNLFGGASLGAPFYCFAEINTRLDRYGNCGYSMCDIPNVLCGKLVCSWPHRRLINIANLSVTYTHFRDAVCVSAHNIHERPPDVKNTSETTFYTAEDRDETFVEDGTPCGPDMFCNRFNCKEIRFFLNYDQCRSSVHCHKRGICNNFNNCHCEKNFAPPNCTPMPGEFGSINDGHPTKKRKLHVGINVWKTKSVEALKLQSYLAQPSALFLGASIT